MSCLEHGHRMHPSRQNGSTPEDDRRVERRHLAERKDRGPQAEHLRAHEDQGRQRRGDDHLHVEPRQDRHEPGRYRQGQAETQGRRERRLLGDDPVDREVAAARAP